uniref:Microbial-type PARG catalytic domain-containing protein n=1 Tax=Pelagomonas calceolata TaxID=35677 RepID=A0A7S3ZPB6_9STRA
MAALDEDDAAQRRRRKQRHEGETLFEDGDVAEHGQEIFEPLPSRREWDPAGYLRIEVLRDTLARLSTPDKRRAFHDLASKNLARWASGAQQPSSTVVEVLPGDWGDVTLTLTKSYGRTFAVLNMANAYLFGGGYAHGQVAQEENMFRRTDCADRRRFTRVA